MASYDRKFNVLFPSLDRLIRQDLEVSDLGLINPTGTSPVPLIDGELVIMDASNKWIRATDPALPAFHVIEDRGDYGVQASRKMAAIVSPGMNFQAETIVFDTALATLGQALMGGAVNNAAVGGVARRGLVAHTGSNVKLGFVLRLPAGNRNLLTFISALA